MATSFRSLNYALDPNSENYAKLQFLYEFLESEFHAVIQELRNSGIVYDKVLLRNKGKFRDQFLSDFGLRHKNHTWDTIKGCKAKYYRIIIDNVRLLLLSEVERLNIINICEKYDYSLNNIQGIRSELTADNLYPTTGYLRNILRSRGNVNHKTNPRFMLNFTVEDNKTSKVNISPDRVVYMVNVNGEWLDFVIDRPVYVPQFVGKVARPIIQRNAKGELYIRVSYEVKTQDYSDTSSTIMGVDLGKVKPFSAAISTQDFYTTELAPTKETDIVAHKIFVLENERNKLNRKINNCSTVWDGSNNYLAHKIERLYCEKRHVVNKLSRLRKSLAWLIARDIAYHCQVNGVDTVKLENLSWLEARGGKWNFSDIQDTIHQVLSAYGIAVYKVNPKDSSQVDPFTDKRITHSGRNAHVSVGVRDRDYLASLELTKRPGKKYRKKDKCAKSVKATTLPVRCRDKHAPTPRRAKPVRKKTLHKLIVKNIFSEHHIAVGALGRDSITTPCKLKSRTSNATVAYTSNINYYSSWYGDLWCL